MLIAAGAVSVFDVRLGARGALLDIVAGAVASSSGSANAAGRQRLNAGGDMPAQDLPTKGSPARSLRKWFSSSLTP